MTCDEVKRRLPFMEEDGDPGLARGMRRHLETCSACKQFEEEYRRTVGLLLGREQTRIPRGLEKTCIRAVEGVPGTDTPFGRFLWLPRPVFQGALALFLFLAGLLFGKMIFEPPSWLGRYRTLASRSAGDFRTGERMLHNYFLAVQTVFLDITNMENPGELDPEEWKVEREIIDEIVMRTREIKSMAREDRPDLYRLVSEIEMVLDEVRGYSDSELANNPNWIKERVEEEGLLLKIRDFIS